MRVVRAALPPARTARTRPDQRIGRPGRRIAGVPRLPRPLLVLLAIVLVLVTVPPLLVQTARLRVDGTVLLPGAAVADGYLVSGTPSELSYALDIRNAGAAPLTVIGLADPRQGPYTTRPGRGGPGGGLPEEVGFAPFRLWPGQTRLVVVHLTLAGPPAPVRITAVRLATRVLGVDRSLEVALPARLRTGG